MGRRSMIGALMFLCLVASATAHGGTDCTAVSGFMSACSAFVNSGWPFPTPGSPCCEAVVGLNDLADDSTYNRQALCRCLTGLVTPTHIPNVDATMTTLPGFCGVVSLGFTIGPNTDCNYVT